MANLENWIAIVIMTLIAGMAMPLGAVIATFERIRPRWLEAEVRHAVIAFGGGALLSSVALVLVPEGMVNLNAIGITFCFMGGAMVFMLLDIFLAKKKTAGSQLVAMLSDFIPEALALGATFALSKSAGFLLAGIIALQNLPEGFNACREIKDSTHYRSSQIIFAFMLMALLGPISGLTGYYLLADFPKVVSGIMLFAAGGILYIVFQDIAPQAKLNKHWAPPVGAAFGFLIGMLGKVWIGV